MEWLTDAMEGTAAWLDEHAVELAGGMEPKENIKKMVASLHSGSESTVRGGEET